MSVIRYGKKLSIAVIFVLLCSAVGFAFPLSPVPSAIDSIYFPGSWSNAFRSFSSDRNSSIDRLRVMFYFDKEFMEAGGPGGTNDLKIWNTPAFTADKMKEDKSAQAWITANPTGVVLDKDASGLGHLSGTVRGVPVSEGRSLFTTHNELVAFVEKLPRTNLSVEYLGEIPRGFPFPFLVFSTSSDRSPEALAASGKPLVWVQGLIHGGEWSAGEGATAMAYDLATGRYDDLLAKINVIIVPRVCADGAKFPIRTTNDLVALQWTPSPERRDLNRDNMLLDLQVTRAMRKLNMAYRPHFIIDMHERGSSNINNTVTTTFGMKIDNDAHDIGASGTTILQVPSELTAIRYNYMEKDLQAFGNKYGVHFGLYREGTDTYNHGIFNNYGPGMPYEAADYKNSMVNSTAWDPDAPYFLISEASYNTRSSRNINAMPGVVSQLFENKAGPTNVGNRGMFERRVGTGYICILSTLTTAANRADELLPKIMDIRKSFVEKGKKVSNDDMIPILTIQPKPRYITEREWTVLDIDKDYTGAYDNAFSPANPVADLTHIDRYDGTKALKSVAAGTGYDGSNYVPVKGTGSRDHQFFKVEETWKGTNVRERIRPYAYIFEGPYAEELATRMLLAGIDVKRLSEDVAIDVEGWHYNARKIGSDGGVGPYIDLANSGSSGWLNRDVTIYPISGRLFKKDSYVVYLGQLMSNLIPMYMEPDLPWSVSSCIFLPYMSVALGGASSGALHPDLVGVEMPAYRYLKEVDLPTYDMNHFLPLVDRGAVARFFSYSTLEEVEKIAQDLGETPERIKVYNYDFQVHTRTDALVDGKFNITLPTSSANSTYMILNGESGEYEKLDHNSKMFGWNVATIDVATHGNDPFTVDIRSNGRPVVGDGSERTLPNELPAHDDLIGVSIIEIEATPETGGSSGCNSTGGSAGFLMFALLAVIPLMGLRKRNHF